MIEVFYSPKYNEFVLREFEGQDLVALEYHDDFDITIWEKYEKDTWLYWGKL